MQKSEKSPVGTCDKFCDKNFFCDKKMHYFGTFTVEGQERSDFCDKKL